MDDTDLTTGEDGKTTQPMEVKGAGSDMIYTIEDVPPWYLCILLGLQVMTVYWFRGLHCFIQGS